VATKTKLPPEGLAAFIDIETTGLRAGEHEIIQLSVALFRFKRDTGEILEVVDTYTGFQEPINDIPVAATRVNGITYEDVAGQALDRARIEAIVDPAEFLVAHNATFDREFLMYEFAWAYEKPWKCSMRHIDWAAKGFTSRKLQTLLKAHGIKVDKAHRADADVKYALQLLNYDTGNGTRYFLEIIKHRALPRPRVENLELALPKYRLVEPAASKSTVEPGMAIESVPEQINIPQQKGQATKTGASKSSAAKWIKRVVGLWLYIGILALSRTLFVIVLVTHLLIRCIKPKRDSAT
jgi:DNA polymerase-3 subunit epsilon